MLDESLTRLKKSLLYRKNTSLNCNVNRTSKRRNNFDANFQQVKKTATELLFIVVKGIVYKRFYTIKTRIIKGHNRTVVLSDDIKPYLRLLSVPSPHC